MSITESLDELYEELDAEGVNLSDYGIYDEEDLTIFALNYLMSHLIDAFENLDIEEDLVAV